MTGLHELVEAQVARTPDAVAVTDADGVSLTYRQLDEHANQIAHHLRGKGVVADTPVAICMDRGLDMVVALCGVLKAGGAYLPVDPDTPAARVRVLIEQSSVPVCVGQQSTADRLPGDLCEVVLTDRDRARIDQAETRPIDSGVRSEHLVSIYYTSGSTGTPKGVASTHGGWVNRMRWMQDEHQLRPRETVLHKTTLSFDDSAVEIFWPLSVGGTVAILPPGEHKDPVALLSAARRTEAAVVQFVPSMLGLFLEAHRRAGLPTLPHLRHVISSGEALTAPLALAFHEQLGVYGCRLHNQWGATEVSIDSTLHTYDPHDPYAGPVVSIGSPFTGNTVHVLDEAGVPVADGELGELHIGGVGLARGYHRKPGLTAGAFLPDPFGPPGVRLYRTGDLGRRRPDGALEFAGRTDHQVKIRGIRIELGEVEAALEAFPEVRQCVATVDGDSLLAYVTGTDPQPAHLRSALSARLPAHLVPARIVPVDEIPLTTSGKVDRLLLAASATPAAAVPACRPPATATQRALAAIWADVLNIDQQVGLDDKFFELGGNSLLATQVMFRVQDDLAVEFPLYLIFAAETLEELAAEVDASRAGQTTPMPRVARDGPLRLSFGQERLWFLQRFAPGSFAYNTPTACRLSGVLNVDAFTAAFDQLVARHEVLRTRYTENGDGIPYAVIDAEGPRLVVGAASGPDRAAQEADAMAVLRSDWERPFDLTAAVPVRARLTRIDDYEHIFSLVIHHISYDARSDEVLWRELAALYEAAVSGRPTALPEQESQYADFAAWQRQQADGADQAGDEERRRLDYWRGQLAGLEPVTVADEPGMPGFAGARITFTVDAPTTRALREIAGGSGTTVFAALLAGFQATLARITGRDEATVGSTVPGRTRLETEDMIGFFTNTIVLRTRCGDAQSFAGLLERVRDVIRDAYAHEVPFERVVRELRPARRPGRTPLFDVIFNGIPLSALSGAETARFAQVTAAPLDLAARTTVAELVCSVAETPDSIIGELMYDTGTVSATRAEELVDKWLYLLVAAARDPRSPLPALSPALPA